MSIWGDAAMNVMRRLAATACLGCLGCLVLTGCGERAQEAAPTTTGGVDVAGAPDPGGEKAPGAPKPGGGGDDGGPAPGSPLHMPARTRDYGQDLDEKLAYIEGKLTEECGGRLCVKVKVEYSHEGERCKYYDSRPAPESTFRYRKNMTITIIAGTEPCDEASESADPEASPEPSDEASDGTSPEESPTDG
jgi:hypothetical protein